MLSPFASLVQWFPTCFILRVGGQYKILIATDSWANEKKKEHFIRGAGSFEATIENGVCVSSQPKNSRPAEEDVLHLSIGPTDQEGKKKKRSVW